MCIEQLSVVAAGPAHADVLATMHAACFEDPWGVASLQTLLEQPGVFGVIVLSVVQPVSFVLCRIISDEGEILTCGVMPAFRGRGVGHRMMESVLAEMERRGGKRIFLEVAEGNDAARRLYAGLGMRIVGRRYRYYRLTGGGTEDALILRRDS